MDIKKNILKTVYWFDLFDRPLSDVEINKFLFGQKPSLLDIRRQLRKMTSKHLSRRGNLFCIKGREQLFDIYKERQKYSSKKWKKAKRVGYLLYILPYIKAVAVTQNLAIDNAKEKSDIDLFIITSKKGIWIARAIVNFVLDIFRLRSPKNKSFVCPNFFISKDRLNINDLVLNKNDVYLPFWVTSMKLIFGKKIFNDFLRANNWTKDFFPNILPISNNEIKYAYIFWPIKKVLEILFLLFYPLESYLESKQVDKINNYSKKMNNKSIVLDNKTAKIHYEDNRSYYYQRWRNNLKSVDISV